MTAEQPGTRSTLDSWRAELREPDLESAYREFDFPSAKRRVITFAMLAFCSMAFFTSVEFLFREWQGAFLTIQLARILLLVLIGVGGALLMRVGNARSFERAAFIAVVVITGLSVSVPLLRPREYLGNYVSDVVLLLSYYVIYPCRLRLLLVPALFFTVFELVVLFSYKEVADPYFANLVVLSLITANILGIYASWHANTVSRLRYVEYRKEATLRRELQEAFEQLKVLSGMIPICSHCKRVRTDSGFWEQVESFVTRGTGLVFSHSICPECVDEHYGELMD